MSFKTSSRSNPTSMATKAQQPNNRLFATCIAIHHLPNSQSINTDIHCSHQLAHSLSTLSTTSNALPTSLPPEIIEYIDSGRNPDIYTREMIEAVQRSNTYLKGKSEAFAGFRDCLADEIVRGMPGCEERVRQALEYKGVETAAVQEEMNEEVKMNGNVAGT